MAVSQDDVRAVQAYYPRIYLACHTRHVRRRSTSATLTANDSSVLAHLHHTQGMRPSVLARHLGIVKSSLSATLKRLESLGYIARVGDATDRRATSLRLTAAGTKAMQAGSVLDTKRVSALLARLAPADRARAVDGLGLLAKAADLLPKKELRRQ
jgi:DNA-binding MarR family transcriptional regulator